MRVFADTNILLDWIDRERPCHSLATTILSAAADGYYDLYVSTQSIIDCAYVLGKTTSDKSLWADILMQLHQSTRIVGIDEIDMLWAMAHSSGDFEDDMQHACAYNNICDFFITRDKGLFRLNSPFCPMQVITPEDFVSALRP